MENVNSIYNYIQKTQEKINIFSVIIVNLSVILSILLTLNSNLSLGIVLFNIIQGAYEAIQAIYFNYETKEYFIGEAFFLSAYFILILYFNFFIIKKSLYGFILSLYNKQLIKKLDTNIDDNNDLLKLKDLLIKNHDVSFYPLNAINSVLKKENLYHSRKKFNIGYGDSWIFYSIVTIMIFGNNFFGDSFLKLFPLFLIPSLFFITIYLIFQFIFIASAINLSEQTLIHRKNILYAFILSVMIDTFKFKISIELIDSYSSKDVLIVKGAIGFFALYSGIEYYYNIIKDSIYGKNKDKPIVKNLITFMIGFMTTLFDFIVPFLAIYTVFYIFNDDIVKFTNTLTDSISMKLFDMQIHQIIEKVKNHLTIN